MKAAPRKLLIVGAVGLGTEYAWVAEEMNHAAVGAGEGQAVWEILGFTDDAPPKKDTTIAGYLVHGTIQETFADWTRWYWFCRSDRHQHHTEMRSPGRRSLGLESGDTRYILPPLSPRTHT